MRCLLHFSQARLEFREAEWQSLCILNGLEQYSNAINGNKEALAVVDLESVEHIQSLLERSMLLKTAYEIYHVTGSHEEMFKWLNSRPDIVKTIDAETNSWALRIRSVGKKQNNEYVQKLLEDYVEAAKIDEAIVDLKTPKYDLSVVEFVSQGKLRVYFVRTIGVGQTRLKHDYSLKERTYIGNTVMDPELAFLQSNLSFVKPNDLVLDPFCGTGGLLLSAAHFGAFVLGTEINYCIGRAIGKSSRQGEGDLKSGHHSIEANFKQYKLESQFLSVILADASKKLMWNRGNLFDAIVTDPPYGVREKSRQLGPKQRKPDWIDTGDSDAVKFPEKVPYELSNTYLDLMDFSAEYLRLGGHVSFWYPIVRESYSDDCLPSNKSLKLISNCEQILTTKCSRRLLVYKKVADFEEATIIKFNAFESARFRDIILNNF